MRFGFAVAIVAVALTLTVCPNATAVDGDILSSGNYLGHYYEVRQWSEAINWQAAQDQCASHGGHLATIRAPGENNFITGLLGWACNGTGFGAWIGLHDANSEGVWEWVNNEPLTYTSWSPAHGPAHPNTDRNYVYMICPHYEWGNWKDTFLGASNKLFRCVCEYSNNRYVYYIPVAANLLGSNSTTWMSDLQIKAEAETAQVLVELLERDADNSDPVGMTFTVNPWTTRRLIDILGAEFEYSGAAGLRVTILEGASIISSRTYNNDAVGTYGHNVPPLLETDAFEFGEAPTVIQLTENERFRTNLGFLNPTNRPMTLAVDLYRAPSTFLGRTFVDLSPYDSQQTNRVFSWVTSDPVDDGYAIVHMTTLDGRFFPFSMVIDNDTGDAVFQYGQRSDPTVVFTD